MKEDRKWCLVENLIPLISQHSTSSHSRRIFNIWTEDMKKEKILRPKWGHLLSWLQSSAFIILTSYLPEEAWLFPFFYQIVTRREQFLTCFSRFHDGDYIVMDLAKDLIFLSTAFCILYPRIQRNVALKSMIKDNRLSAPFSGE